MESKQWQRQLALVVLIGLRQIMRAQRISDDRTSALSSSGRPDESKKIQIRLGKFLKLSPTLKSQTTRFVAGLFKF